jgi:hypothetical protein
MTFSKMLELLKMGRKMLRTDPLWPPRYLSIQHPQNDSLLTEPFVFGYTHNRSIVPYFVSNEDLFADDWEIKV